MSGILQITHEGTTVVQRVKSGTLAHEYEIFIMKPEESLSQKQTHYSHIVIHIKSLGKHFKIRN